MNREEILSCLKLPHYSFPHILIDEVLCKKAGTFLYAHKNTYKSVSDITSHTQITTIIEGVIQCIVLMIYNEDPYRRGVFREITDLSMLNPPQYAKSIVYRVWQLREYKQKNRRYFGTAFVDQKLVVRAIFTFEIV